MSIVTEASFTHIILYVSKFFENCCIVKIFIKSCYVPSLCIECVHNNPKLSQQLSKVRMFKCTCVHVHVCVGSVWCVCVGVCSRH